MKPIFMFVAGAVLAGSLVLIVTRQEDKPKPEVQIPTAQTQPAPVPPQPAVVSETPEPVVSQPVPERERVTASRRPAAVEPARREPNRRTPAVTPERPASAGNTTPAPQPAQTAQNTTAGPVIPVDSVQIPAPPTNARPGSAIEERKPEPRQPKTVTIPAGTLLTVRVDETLSTEKNGSGDSFKATLDQPLIVDGMVIAERGSRVEGRVVETDPGGRVRGVARMTLELVRLNTSDGQRLRLQTESFAREGERGTKKDAAKIGAAAGIGAAIGAIAGGGKGAAIGAGVGAAAGTGGVMATRGGPAQIPAETRLSFRLREPITTTEKLQ